MSALTCIETPYYIGASANPRCPMKMSRLELGDPSYDDIINTFRKYDDRHFTNDDLASNRMGDYFENQTGNVSNNPFSYYNRQIRNKGNAIGAEQY